MNYEHYGEVHLYYLTLLLYNKKNNLIPKNCDSRCIYSTIINRAYYSSFLASKLWLEDNYNIKTRTPKEFNQNEKFVTEHTQVILNLKKVKKHSTSEKLRYLKKIRKKADYQIVTLLKKEEVDYSIKLMKDIFKDTLFSE